MLPFLPREPRTSDGMPSKAPHLSAPLPKKVTAASAKVKPRASAPTHPPTASKKRKPSPPPDISDDEDQPGSPTPASKPGKKRGSAAAVNRRPVPKKARVAQPDPEQSEAEADEQVDPAEAEDPGEEQEESDEQNDYDAADADESREILQQSLSETEGIDVKRIVKELSAQQKAKGADKPRRSERSSSSRLDEIYAKAEQAMAALEGGEDGLEARAEAVKAITVHLDEHIEIWSANIKALREDLRIRWPIITALRGPTKAYFSETHGALRNLLEELCTRYTSRPVLLERAIAEMEAEQNTRTEQARARTRTALDAKQLIRKARKLCLYNK